MRHPAGQQVIQRRTQAIDVRRWRQFVVPTLGLLGAHVGGRTDGRSHLRRRRVRPVNGVGHHSGRQRHVLVRTDHLGQAPVDHQRLAELAEHDVRRFQVAMDHAFAMRVVDCVAHMQEPREQLPQLRNPFPARQFYSPASVKAVEHLQKAFTANEPHRVIWPSRCIGPHGVNRHHARMFEPPSYPRFQQESVAAIVVVRPLGFDLFERDRSLDFPIAG